MITRITIRTDESERLTVTRTSIRYEKNEGSPGEKWTVTSKKPSFEKMFRNLCEEVEQIMTLPEASPSRDGSTTTFSVMYDDGKKEERTLSEPDERYTICFTIIEQMHRYAET